jgi:SAM-dependent methyltransferase
MKLRSNLVKKEKQDRRNWIRCAEAYERQIVSGHPDIHGYERFEEDFIDRLLLNLLPRSDRRVALTDFGCGSGRVLLRVGSQCVDRAILSEKDLSLLNQRTFEHPELAWNPLFNERINSLCGIEFSSPMINIAKNKIRTAGLGVLMKSQKIRFVVGSAFETRKVTKGVLPLDICLMNSIGVMQGVTGAKKLIRLIYRRACQYRGIGIISFYQRESLETCGLQQYESTMEVSGLPDWIDSGNLPVGGYKFRNKSFQRGLNSDPVLFSDVFRRNGRKIASVAFLRDVKKVQKTIQTGIIRTSTGYESHWYGWNQVEEWVRVLSLKGVLHVKGKWLDPLRAHPLQLLIVDPHKQIAPWVESLYTSS